MVVVSPVSPSSTGSMFPQMALCHGGGSSSAKPSFLLMYRLCGEGDGDAAAVGEDVGDELGDGGGVFVAGTGLGVAATWPPSRRARPAMSAKTSTAATALA